MHLIDSLCDGWTTGKDYLQLRFELVFSYASSFSSDASCKDLEGSTEFCQAYSGPVDREAFPDLLPREGKDFLICSQRKDFLRSREISWASGVDLSIPPSF